MRGKYININTKFGLIWEISATTKIQTKHTNTFIAMNTK